MIEVIKYLFLGINSIYVFTKLLGKNVTKKMFLFGLFYSLLIAFSTRWTRMYVPALTVTFLVVSIMFFMSFFYRTSIQTCTIVAIISVASIYGLYTLLTFLFVTFFFLLSIPLAQNPFLDGITNLIIGILTLFFSYLLFHSKRFRNGIPSLKQRGSNTTGVFIGISILCLASLLTPIIQPDWLWMIPIFTVLMCSFLLYLWWRTRIRKDYLERVRVREATIIQER